MKAVGRTFSSVPVTTSTSSSQKMPKSSSNRFFILHYILILYRWICSIFQSISGHMKFTHLIDEQQDVGSKHEEPKNATSWLDNSDSSTELRRRLGKGNALSNDHQDQRNAVPA